MQQKQHMKTRNPIVIVQHLKHAMMGVGPIVGVESAQIKDNDTIYEMTFCNEQVSSVRIFRKGAIQGEVSFDEKDGARICKIITQDQCALIGLKNNEKVAGPVIIGSKNSENLIDSAVHIGWHNNLSIMSGDKWAYLRISNMGLRKDSVQDIHKNAVFTDEGHLAKVVIRSDEGLARRMTPVMTNPEHTKNVLKSKKRAVFSALGHLSREEQISVLNQFLSIVNQVKKRSTEHE